MRIGADSNVLLRLVIDDDPAQQRIAIAELQNCEEVAISLAALCEVVWVLRRRHRVPRTDIAAAIRTIVRMRNVVTNAPAVEAGLAMLDAGGDFADGVIAFECRWLDADTFVSFDRTAIRLLQQQNVPARLLA